MRFRLVIVLLLFCMPLGAKVSLAVSKSMSGFVSNESNLSQYTKSLVQNDEVAVLESFVKHEAKLAIVREDILATFHQNREAVTQAPYHIIGKVSAQAVLYFATHRQGERSLEERFIQKRISIGNLGDRSDVYLKDLLKEKNILYQSTLLSLDPYRSLNALRKKEIDGFFIFAPEHYKKLFSKYLRDYPKELKESLAEKKSLQCHENERYCRTSYFLIASDSLGKEVMENLYVQMQTDLKKKKRLASYLGKYYIYTGLKKSVLPFEKKVVAKEKKKTIHFRRTPWMDTAIEEAIKGKGSAENVLPMLDLSYKYIRFAKGNSGITTAPNDNKEGSWCAAYICWTLNKSGYKVHRNGRMASQSFRYFNNKVYRKIDKPIFGAIALYTNMKKQTHGHVGYLFGKTKNGKYILLGGNQSNRLKFANYPERFGSYKLKGFYVPIDYEVKTADYLSKKDIYPSARYLNKKYGIERGKHNNSVR